VVWEYDDDAAYVRIETAVRHDPESATASEAGRRLGRLYLARDEWFARSTLD
jgi:hypothetical protein